MEQLRDFKIKFYVDTNKRTNEKILDISNYGSVDALLKDAKNIIASIELNGLLEVL